MSKSMRLYGFGLDRIYIKKSSKSKDSSIATYVALGHLPLPLNFYFIYCCEMADDAAATPDQITVALSCQR